MWKGPSLRLREDRLLACDGVEMKLETAEDEDALAARITAILEQKQPVASRLVRLHQYYWLRTVAGERRDGEGGELTGDAVKM